LKLNCLQTASPPFPRSSITNCRKCRWNFILEVYFQGQKPDYLIEHQVKAAPLLEKKIEFRNYSNRLFTSESGGITAVEK
jgi:hypothetical protein